MKKFPHQQFIEYNGIVIDKLPLQLQKRIKGFEELENDLQHTTEHDREQLVDRLEALSYELEEDLEEQFEDQLENNDEEEEEEEEPLETITVQEKENKKDVVLPEILDHVETENKNTDLVTDPEEEILSEDEEILKKLFTTKQLKVSPVQLIRKGLKAKLDKKIIRIGKYALCRGKYDTCYQLTLAEK